MGGSCFIFVLALTAVSASTATAEAKGWRGIVPLHLLTGLVATDSPRTQAEQAAQQQTPRPIRDYDDGGGLSFEEDKPRIDRFAEEMKRNGSAEAYIIAYGGLVSYKNEAAIRLRCIQNYLVTTHKIPLSRLKLIDGGYRVEVSVQLFLVKPEDTKPTAFGFLNREAVGMNKAPKHRCGKATRARSDRKRFSSRLQTQEIFP
jgi:hypothetical protein